MLHLYLPSSSSPSSLSPLSVHISSVASALHHLLHHHRQLLQRAQYPLLLTLTRMINQLCDSSTNIRTLDSEGASSSSSALPSLQSIGEELLRAGVLHDLAHVVQTLYRQLSSSSSSSSLLHAEEKSEDHDDDEDEEDYNDSSSQSSVHIADVSSSSSGSDDSESESENDSTDSDDASSSSSSSSSVLSSSKLRQQQHQLLLMSLDAMQATLASNTGLDYVCSR